jgi:integrase
MGSLQKNHGPNWYASYYKADGSRAFKSTGTPDKKLANQIMLQFEEAEKQGRAQRLTMKRVRDTLSEIYASLHGEELPADETGPFLTQWLERKSSELTESSVSAYKQTVDQFLEFIGSRKDKPLDAITKAIVTDWRDSLLKRVAPATARKQVVILRAAFNDAIREGRARENPALDVKVRKTQGQKRMPFTSEEITRLLAAADQEWRAMILTTCCTGVRLGDVASLDWESVNLEAMEIRFAATKTGQDMKIPIADQLHECLCKLPTFDKGGPVFPEANATYQRAGTSSLSNQFRQIMHKAGLAEEPTHQKTGDGRDAKRTVNKLSFHSLRHCFVSNLKMSGAGDSVAKELAGHSSDAVSRVYTHGDPAALRAAVNKLPKLTIPEVTE